MPHPFSTKSAPFSGEHSWRKVVARYQRPTAWKGLWQIANTVIPYAALWWLMYRSLSISGWLAMPLALLAGGFLVRIFIIFHDCAHCSFFQSRLANEVLGSL